MQKLPFPLTVIKNVRMLAIFFNRTVNLYNRDCSETNAPDDGLKLGYVISGDLGAAETSCKTHILSHYCSIHKFSR